MKIILINLSLFICGFSCFAQSNVSIPTPARHPFVIVAFGTSLTESAQVAPDKRWASLLQDTLRQMHTDLEITLVNAGIGGNTTRDRLQRIAKDVLAKHPDLVISDFATNDATYKPESHVSLDEFVRNIKLMHDQIVNTGAAEIYWPQTPILSEKHVYRDQPIYIKAGGVDKYVKAYRKCTAKISRKLHVPFVDMDAIFRKKIKGKGANFYLCPDGVHHLESGNRLVAESLLPAVEKIIQDRTKPVTSGAGDDHCR